MQDMVQDHNFVIFLESSHIPTIVQTYIYLVGVGADVEVRMGIVG